MATALRNSGKLPDRRCATRGLFLTAGVDIQKNRIECEVVAWVRQKQSWSVDYYVLDGDTAKPEVWAKLAELGLTAENSIQKEVETSQETDESGNFS